jgi:hypothetical protein
LWSPLSVPFRIIYHHIIKELCCIPQSDGHKALQEEPSYSNTYSATPFIFVAKFYCRYACMRCTYIRCPLQIARKENRAQPTKHDYLALTPLATNNPAPNPAVPVLASPKPSRLPGRWCICLQPWDLQKNAYAPKMDLDYCTTRRFVEKVTAASRSTGGCGGASSQQRLELNFSFPCQIPVSFPLWLDSCSQFL